MEQKIYKQDNDSELDRAGLVALGKHIENDTDIYRLLKQWKKMRKDKLMKELFILSTNPDITDRIIGVSLGKIKAMEDDLEMLFKLAIRTYNAKEKEKKDSEA